MKLFKIQIENILFTLYLQYFFLLTLSTYLYLKYFSLPSVVLFTFSSSKGKVKSSSLYSIFSTIIFIIRLQICFLLDIIIIFFKLLQDYILHRLQICTNVSTQCTL